MLAFPWSQSALHLWGVDAFHFFKILFVECTLLLFGDELSFCGETEADLGELLSFDFVFIVVFGGEDSKICLFFRVCHPFSFLREKYFSL